MANFAERVSQIQPSQTLGITALVQSMRREGKNVIGLGAGEPDFDTPEPIKKAAIEAIREGFTKYTPISGTIELKEAICEKYEHETGVKFSPAEVLVSCGAKHSLANALLALCEAGNEVIIPAPYWTTYIELVRFVGATPVVLHTHESTDFKITPEQLAGAITSRTRVLLLNSPSNPTGSVYSKKEMEALLTICAKHDFYILYDEIYEKILYDSNKHVTLASYPELRQRLVLLNGVSKTYAMTGWRIGFMVAPEALIKACNKIQSHTTSNPCSISQRASVAALKLPAEVLRSMVVEFDKRRKFLTSQLNDIPGVACTVPGGAFYTFPNIKECLGLSYKGKQIANAMDLTSYLLEEGEVAVVPGEAFGSDIHIRISYATSMKNLEEAMVRMRKALTNLRAGA